MQTAFIAGHGGARLAVHRLGAGRPVVLLHGLFSSGEMNWRRYGAATEIASAGYRVIMPDFRAHGHSAAPHDAAAYPPDVLAMDIEALIAQLGLTDFDIAGYSMGARTLVRLLARLGCDRQVLCVTHLPQVAACADWQWRIAKRGQDGETVSEVTVLDDAARVEEIARMLGGVKITSTTREHAAEMLGRR